ncbi:MAG: HAD-IA family hydrolase [Armatimonadota bacterium]|nr:HAD-IA family hydrolase [Armatimonadota bacterium]
MQPESSVLLIFDFDNTLIDSRINFSELRAALIDLLETAASLPAPRAELMRLPIHGLVELGQERSQDLARRMWGLIETFEAEGLEGAEVMPHAHDVLEALASRGYRLALLTNNARPATARLLEALGLAAFLPLVVTRDDVPRLKPDPAGIRLILERVGPIRLCYVVGDSWLDGQAAHAAGVRFIGFGPRQREVAARGVAAWAWVTDLRELLALSLDS